MHEARRAASRADCTAGSKSEIKTAMIAITTKSSISVNARRVGRDRRGGRTVDASNKSPSSGIPVGEPNHPSGILGEAVTKITRRSLP